VQSALSKSSLTTSSSELNWEFCPLDELLTKKSHLSVAFFQAQRITSWLARKQRLQLVRRRRREPKLPQLEQMRERQVRGQEQQLVQEQLLVQELLLFYRKQPRQRQR